MTENRLLVEFSAVFVCTAASIVVIALIRVVLSSPNIVG